MKYRPDNLINCLLNPEPIGNASVVTEHPFPNFRFVANVFSEHEFRLVELDGYTICTLSYKKNEPLELYIYFALINENDCIKFFNNLFEYIIDNKLTTHKKISYIDNTKVFRVVNKDGITHDESASGRFSVIIPIVFPFNSNQNDIFSFAMETWL